MNSFAYIASHFFPETDILKSAFAFPENRSSVINTDFISYGFLNSLHFGKSKFSVLESSVLKNMYIDGDRRENMLEVFSKTQRTYRGFSRLALIHKIKHSRTYNVDTDLCFNSLTSLSNKIVTSIYDDNSRTIYRFRITDIMNITKSALSNAPSFFTEPLSIKNPYTNLPFSISQLYHLYFVVKESPYVMPSLFHHFFELNFDLDEFANRYEALIRDESIKMFLLTSTHEQKYYHIVKMITSYEGHIRNIDIHPDFPVDKLVEGLSPFLKDYLYGVYSLNPSFSFHAKRRLRTTLIRFTRLNPSYGRKIFRRNRFTDVNIDISGAAMNTYSPSSSYHSDPRPGHENLSFRFVDDIVTEPPTMTPRQIATRQRLRQEGVQQVSPERQRSPMRNGLTRNGPTRNSYRRQEMSIARTRYSPQNYHINDDAGAIAEDTESTYDSDDASTTSQDTPHVNTMSGIYDGTESLDHESEDHMESVQVIGHRLNIEEEDNNTGVVVEGSVSSDSSVARDSESASPDRPSGPDQLRDIRVENDGIRHTHEDMDEPYDTSPDVGSISEHTRELISATILDIIGDQNGDFTDIIGNIPFSPTSDILEMSGSPTFVSEMALPMPMSPSPIPVPPLPIPERLASNLSFPEPPPPPLPMPAPLFPATDRRLFETTLEFELSINTAFAPPNSSDDD